MTSTSHDRYDHKVALYNSKSDILSVYFFRARPQRVADNFKEIVAHAHAKAIYQAAFSFSAA